MRPADERKPADDPVGTARSRPVAAGDVCREANPDASSGRLKRTAECRPCERIEGAPQGVIPGSLRPMYENLK